MKTTGLLHLSPWAIVWLAIHAVFSQAASDQVLFDIRRGDDWRALGATDATITEVQSATGNALRIRTGHTQPWPGISLNAPAGSWNLSDFEKVLLTIKNVGTNALTVYCRVDNPGADGVRNCVTHSVRVPAGRSAELEVALTRVMGNTLGGTLFGMRGYPVAQGGDGTINPKNITQLLVFTSKPTEDHLFELGPVVATGTYVPPTAWISDATPFIPFIDTCGQYRHRDWPGKTKTVSDLSGRREQELKDLANEPGPKDWDAYGGWSQGPQLQATGFFRTEKHKGKWWLVDPEGRLFFSHGIDCVRMLDTTPVEDRESWFEQFPGLDPNLSEFSSPGYALKGHYQGRSPRCFSFAGANLKRKYGPDWQKLYPPVIHQRLRGWGLNTIGNWSHESVTRLRRTPYTDAINSGRVRMVEGSEGYWGKFPDVFDRGFTNALRQGMESKRNGSAGDPWCLGYFSDNEMSWGDEVSLAAAALKSPPDQPAKQVFLASLKETYQDIHRLNAVWGTTHASWEALQQHRQLPDLNRARKDLAAFYTRTAEHYFRSVRDAIKAVAPHQLYLGCRFADVNARAAAAAAKYCDVVSYNLYLRRVDSFPFNGDADVPLIIGEFHFGALDRGLFHAGLVPVNNQKARAQAYRDYVRGCLSHPQFVGCHWFQYQDEPTTGRVYDEENYQIGFVDIADTPYPEIITASRDMGTALYRLRLGE